MREASASGAALTLAPIVASSKLAKVKVEARVLELLRSRDASDLGFGEFLSELSATYRAVRAGRRGHLAREAQIPDILDQRAVAVEEDGRFHSICRTAPTTRSTPTPRMQR